MRIYLNSSTTLNSQLNAQGNRHFVYRYWLLLGTIVGLVVWTKDTNMETFSVGVSSSLFWYGSKPHFSCKLLLWREEVGDLLLEEIQGTRPKLWAFRIIFLCRAYIWMIYVVGVSWLQLLLDLLVSYYIGHSLTVSFIIYLDPLCHFTWSFDGFSYFSIL